MNELLAIITGCLPLMWRALMPQRMLAGETGEPLVVHAVSAPAQRTHTQLARGPRLRQTGSVTLASRQVFRAWARS
eukprot:COSAG02_NODE_7459_length_3004_cov_2.064028_2_plen_76_part_00